MNNNLIECPVCFQKFMSNFIEEHAQNCIETQSRKKTMFKEMKRKSMNIPDKPLSKIKRISPWTRCIVGGDKNVATSSDSSSIQLSKNIPVISKGLICSQSKAPSLSKHSLSFSKPLSDIARPMVLDDFVGQSDAIGTKTALYKLLQDNIVPSMILWGPPGCGKTTLAHIISCNVKCAKGDKKIFFSKLSATDSGKADLQTAIKAAVNKQRLFPSKTILFVDEIHRFNKVQQDSLLPAIENGTIILIGATTENPSFVLNSALLSRCKVVVLKKLEASHVKTLLLKAVKLNLPEVKIIDTNGGDHITDCLCIYESSLDTIADMCDGDARLALNGLQTILETMQCSDSSSNIVDTKLVKDCLQRTHFLYDRTGDHHYDLTSALHKSIRGNDENAALYWLTRMLLGGEDPRFIARRLIRVASEDVGLADPNAINQAVSCFHACMYVGMPECDNLNWDEFASFLCHPNKPAYFEGFCFTQGTSYRPAWSDFFVVRANIKKHLKHRGPDGHQ